MSIGEKLRTARETKSLSVKDLADQTHVDENIIRDLENDDYHAITALVYGQGFLRLCATRLGLDPAPLVEEFSAAYRNVDFSPAETMVGNYKAQEALYRERSGDSQLFQPSSRLAESTDSAPRPLASPPEVPIQVTVQVDAASAPAPATPDSNPSPQPEQEVTLVVDSPATTDTQGAFAEIFASPAAKTPDAPAPVVSPLEEDENSLFSQASRKPKPVPVDPEDSRPRPMTGIFVPPSRRKTPEPAAEPPSESPAAPAPESPSRPVMVPVDRIEAKPAGPSSAEIFARASTRAASSLGSALRKGAGALARGLGHAGAATGRGASSLGRWTIAHVRSVSMVAAAILVVLLGVWAVLGIRSTIRASRETSRIAIVQNVPVSGDEFVEMTLPPPVLYAR